MKMTRVFQGAGALALALALVPGGASATQIGANSGYPLNGNTCFTSSGGGVTNSCGSNQNWELPLVVFGSGAVQVTINSATTVECGVYTLTAGGGGFAGLPSQTVAGDHVFASITVPTNGTLHGWCVVPPGGTVRSSRWF